MIRRLSDYIGFTPMIELSQNFYAKLEYFNPSGSIKDRACYQMLIDKNVKEGSIVVEATSGNLGISLAFLGAIFKFKVIVVMPKNSSIERVNLIRLYNGKVVFSNDMSDALLIAKLLSNRIRGSIMLNQFDNDSNVLAHYLSTGPEILKSLDYVDYLVCGIGSGGTITGVAKFLKENIKCKIVGVIPDSFPHNIYGIGAGFTPSILNSKFIDEVVTITENDAYHAFKYLNSIGISCGVSSGASYMVAKKIYDMDNSKRVVVIFPDSNDRYLSVLEDVLWKNIKK